jgi:hypothetical protein
MNFRKKSAGSKSPLKGRPLRNPGQSLDEQIDAVLNDKLLVYVLLPLMAWLLTGLEWTLKVRNAPRSPGTFAVLAAVLTVFGAIRIWQLRGRLRTLKLGRDGERVVGQFLEGLREEGARVFHDVPGDGFNLDHVVISERGAFLIETKTWSKRGADPRIRVKSGRLYKDGYLIEPNPITQAIAEAGWLKQLLTESTGKPIPVWPVVVFPGWLIEPMDSETKALAWVLEPKALPAWIEQEPVRLSPEDVRLAAFHLSRYVRSA